VHTWQPRCEIEITPVQEIKDIHVQPDLSSFRVAGWDEGIGVVLCDTYTTDTHEPIDIDPRQMLKATLQKFSDLGYSVNAATELEFYLFRSLLHCSVMESTKAQNLSQ
jgi:glutamine synthetase